MAKKEKILEYINDMQIIFDNKKTSKAETEAAIKRQELREQKLADSPILRNNINRKKVAAKSKSNGVYKLPDPPMDSFDWDLWLRDRPNYITLEDEDKKVEANSLYEEYLELLKGGELLPGTTFQMFEKNYHDFDTDLISQINKRVKRKKLAEGVAALMGEPRKIYYNDKSIRKIPKRI